MHTNQHTHTTVLLIFLIFDADIYARTLAQYADGIWTVCVFVGLRCIAQEQRARDQDVRQYWQGRVPGNNASKSVPNRLILVHAYYPKQTLSKSRSIQVPYNNRLNIQ